MPKKISNGPLDPIHTLASRGRGRPRHVQPGHSQNPVYTRPHPYAPAQGDPRAALREQLLGTSRTQANAAREALGRSLLRAGGPVDRTGIVPRLSHDIARHEAAFKAFVRQAPQLDLVTQTVSYNLTQGADIDLHTARIWHVQNHVDFLEARALACEQGRSWDELKAEIPFTDRLFTDFSLEEQNHLLFTAFRDVTGSISHAHDKLLELYGQDISMDTANQWARQDRVREHRYRETMRHYLHHHPEVTNVDRARLLSNIPRNQMTDTEIGHYIVEAQRVRMLEQALMAQQGSRGHQSQRPAQQPSQSWASTAMPQHDPGAVSNGQPVFRAPVVIAMLTPQLPTSLPVVFAYSQPQPQPQPQPGLLPLPMPELPLPPPLVAQAQPTPPVPSHSTPLATDPLALPDWMQDVFQPEAIDALPDMASLFWPEEF